MKAGYAYYCSFTDKEFATLGNLYTTPLHLAVIRSFENSDRYDDG